MTDPLDSAAERFYEEFFVTNYSKMVIVLREKYRYVRLAEDLGNDRLGAGNVAVASAFLTIFSHFQNGELAGLTEEQFVAECARYVYNRWRRKYRHRDNKHLSYTASKPDGEGGGFEPAVDSWLPENELQLLEYFSQLIGEITGGLTAANPQYLTVIRACLEKPGSQAEIAQRCGCSQAMVSRALNWLRDAILALQRADD